MVLMVMYYLKALGAYYSWTLPRTLMIAYRNHHSSTLKYLKWLYDTKTYKVNGKLWQTDIAAVALLLAVMFATIGSGVYLLVDWARYGTVGYWAFGLALLIIYPLITSHALVVGAFVKRILVYILNPKKLGRAIVCAVLESQVKSLRKKHHMTLVAVAGSVGKTSTKRAIADLLGQTLRVQSQSGNYNDRVTVPLIFFGQTMPSMFNIFAWMRIFGENAASVHHPYSYDVVVVELGTDSPGQMAEFAYLKPDITVLTAITPEHMERFVTLDAVAEEELTIFDYSRLVLVNGDDTPGKYVAGRVFEEYSTLTNIAHNHYAKSSLRSIEGQKLHVETPSGTYDATTKYIGEQGARIALATAAVAHMLGLTDKDIVAGLAELEPFAGRMRLLEGAKNSTVIDDTYNASPVAVNAGLDVLYTTKATQRIAILGSMNELGDYAKEAHHIVGEYCDPNKLDMIVTIGADARRWLAPTANARGCQVHSFSSPYDAGDFVRKHLKQGAVVLAEGSQNGVFAEEAVKKILAHPRDAQKLVRQSKAWLRTKARQFSD